MVSEIKSYILKKARNLETALHGQILLIVNLKIDRFHLNRVISSKVSNTCRLNVIPLKMIS